MKEFSKDEVMLAEGKGRNVDGFILGIVACFIPPFIFGPILLVLFISRDKNTKWILSNNNLTFKGHTFFSRKEITIPVENIEKVRIQETGIINIIFRVANVYVSWLENGEKKSSKLSNITNVWKMREELNRVKPEVFKIGF